MSLNKKINSNKTKHVLVENQLKKLQTFDSVYVRGKSHFEDGTQNYSVFQPMYRYFKRVAGVGSGNHIYFWKSKGLPDENITPPATTDYSLNPKLSYFGTKKRVEFNGRCLKQDKITYNHRTIVNIYTVYQLSSNLNFFYFALEKCLFGTVKLTKITDIDKYKYSGYGIGFDSRGIFSFPSGKFGQNVIIFGVDISSSIHFDNKKKRYFNSW